MMTTKQLVRLIPLLNEFFRFAPLAVCSLWVLMLLNSMTSGLGILLIIPLISATGIDLGMHAGSHSMPVVIEQSLYRFTNWLGMAPGLEFVLTIYVLTLSLAGLILYARTLLSTHIQCQFNLRLRADIYSSLLYAQWQFLNQQRMTDFIRLVTTQVQSVAACVEKVLALMSQFVLAFIYLGLSFYLSPVLTGLALLFAVVLAGLLIPLNKYIFQTGVKSLIANRSMFNEVIEHLVSLKVIKSFAAEDQYLKKVYKASRDMELQRLNMARYSGLTRFAHLIGSAMTFAVLFYTAINVISLPVANLILILFIFARLMPLVTSIQTNLQQLIRLAPEYTDLTHCLDRLKIHNEPKGDGKKVNRVSFKQHIRIHNLGYQHPDKQEPLFSDLNLCLPCNQTIALSGPSGAGKSTLADLVSGLIEPTGGEIFVDDQVLDEHNRHQWRKQIAYVTQEVLLFHDTVRANLNWIRNEHIEDSEIFSVLKLAAADFVMQLPQGLDTVIGDQGHKLSGGERQRLALARALLAKPDLLILDEATSALDAHNEDKIRQALLNLNGKLTILVIAHNERTIAQAEMRINLQEHVLN